MGGFDAAAPDASRFWTVTLAMDDKGDLLSGLVCASLLYDDDEVVLSPRSAGGRPTLPPPPVSLSVVLWLLLRGDDGKGSVGVRGI